MTKVLDASFLMDYEAGVPDARTYLRANTDQEFLLPSVISAAFPGSHPAQMGLSRRVVGRCSSLMRWLPQSTWDQSVPA